MNTALCAVQKSLVLCSFALSIGTDFTLLQERQETLEGYTNLTIEAAPASECVTLLFSLVALLL